MKYTTIIFTALSMLTGCVWHKGTPEHGVYISTEFSDEHHDLIVEALSDWQKKSDGAVSFHHIVNWKLIDNSIVIAPSTQQSLTVYYGKIDGDSTVVGHDKWDLGSDGTANLIEIVTDISNVEFNQVIRHELGHALGLSHNDNENTLMFHSYNEAAKDITCKDLEEFCDIWECSSDIKQCSK